MATGDRPERDISLGKIRKNRACLDTFYDRTFSRAYSVVLEIIDLFLWLN